MKKILIIKNISREGPGLLEDLLKEKGFEYEIVDLDVGDRFPEILDYSAVVVLGGPDSANDETVKMKEELNRVREILGAGIPYLGICLGLQVLVKAAGGKVIQSENREIGFMDPNGNRFSVKLTDEGKKDSVFEGLGSRFDVFHLHGETVKLTDEMKLLGVGEFCYNQIVKVGKNAYGIQCHFELKSEMLELWVKNDPDLLMLEREKLIADFKEIEEDYSEVGLRLFNNFLEML